jgi:hypothetical protein
MLSVVKFGLIRDALSPTLVAIRRASSFVSNLAAVSAAIH